MKPKIIGIGKCGSRVAYDFFAYISDMPSSYYIKIRELSRLGRLLTKFKTLDTAANVVNKTWGQAMSFLHEVFGASKIYDRPEFYTIDSDYKNNEVIQFITENLAIINEVQGRLQVTGKKDSLIVFPGRTMQLSDHSTGCDFQIVSEQIALRWQLPQTLVDPGDADIVAVAFSVGGGTGGGASPVVLQKCKRFLADPRRANRLKAHYMGIAILPNSDEKYSDSATVEAMQDDERYNCGRFFVGVYGKRRYQLSSTIDESHNFAADSYWLFGNDSIRRTVSPPPQQNSSSIVELVMNVLEPVRIPPKPDDKNFAKMNFYIAEALATVCNASSRYTKSQPNFDSLEMTNRFSGSPFISGYSCLKLDRGTGEHNYLVSVQRLFAAALSNMAGYIAETKEHDSLALLGMSVPLYEREAQQVNQLLGGPELGSMRELVERYGKFDFSKSPIEFRTATKAVMIYGQSEKGASVRKEEIARKMCSLVFPNSEFSGYYYTHNGNADRLLILLVNPFIRMVQKSIYYYIMKSWTKPEHRAHLYSRLDSAILDSEFSDLDLKEMLVENEDVSESVQGKGTVEFFEQPKYPFIDADKVHKADIIAAIRYLHSTYHYQRAALPTSTL